MGLAGRRPKNWRDIAIADTSTKRVMDFRTRVIDFYTQHNPENLHNLEEVRTHHRLAVI